MSKVIEFPSGKTLQATLPDEAPECDHRNIAVGRGYHAVSELRYEFDTDVCQDCGAFVTTSQQYEEFKSWLMKQSSTNFRIWKVRLRTNTLKTAKTLTERFHRGPISIYRACLALHSADVLKDEEWEWDTGPAKKYGYKMISPLQVHPLLFLQIHAWSSLAGLSPAEVTGKVIDTCLRQYSSGKWKFIHYLDSYLLL